MCAEASSGMHACTVTAVTAAVTAVTAVTAAAAAAVAKCYHAHRNHARCLYFAVLLVCCWCVVVCGISVMLLCCCCRGVAWWLGWLVWLLLWPRWAGSGQRAGAADRAVQPVHRIAQKGPCQARQPHPARAGHVRPRDPDLPPKVRSLSVSLSLSLSLSLCFSLCLYFSLCVCDAYVRVVCVWVRVVS